ncbi:MAG: DivIVA domain-containing protein [Acidimicrobiia bacterium]|nr:DivIVA domain-containing protein [Acidimicrobiia bacterium]
MPKGVTSLWDRPSARPTFRACWRGYDRAQVDAFLEDTETDRRRLLEAVERVDAVLAEQRSRDPDRRLALAERDAEAIRARAEQQALQTLRRAEAQAESLVFGRLEASRRELEQLARFRADLATCLQAGVTALGDGSSLLGAIAAAHPRTEPDCEVLPPDATAPRRTRPGLVRTVRGGPTAAGMAAVAAAGFILAALLLTGGGWPVTPEAAAPVASARVGSRPDPPARTALDATPAGFVPDLSEGLLLTLTATRESLITMLVDGGQSMDHAMRAGETIVVSAKEDALLWMADAGALSLLINNRPAGALGADGESATIAIDRATAPRLLAGERPHQTAALGASFGNR